MSGCPALLLRDLLDFGDDERVLFNLFPKEFGKSLANLGSIYKDGSRYYVGANYYCYLEMPFCSCSYFMNDVLRNRTALICPHLLAIVVRIKRNVPIEDRTTKV